MGIYYHPHGYGAYQGGYSVNASLPKRLSFSPSFSMVRGFLLQNGAILHHTLRNFDDRNA
jgi:hypothetical protein